MRRALERATTRGCAAEDSALHHGNYANRNPISAAIANVIVRSVLPAREEYREPKLM
jgi:hypothetical protein